MRRKIIQIFQNSGVISWGVPETRFPESREMHNWRNFLATLNLYGKSEISYQCPYWPHYDENVSVITDYWSANATNVGDPSDRISHYFGRTFAGLRAKQADLKSNNMAKWIRRRDCKSLLYINFRYYKWKQAALQNLSIPLSPHRAFRHINIPNTKQRLQHGGVARDRKLEWRSRYFNYIPPDIPALHKRRRARKLECYE